MLLREASHPFSICGSTAARLFANAASGSQRLEQMQPLDVGADVSKNVMPSIREDR
jgi:hypothetical protein